MSMQLSHGKIDFELGTRTLFAPRKAGDDTPFCMAILADFSGRDNRGICEKGASIAARQRVAVDVDNLDELPGKLGCEIHIPIGSNDGPRMAVRFDELDDFGPDQIFDRLEIFQKLKQTRSLLLDPATFAEGASQVHSWTEEGQESEKSETEQPKSSPAQAESDVDAIERLLGKRPTAKPASASAGRLVDMESLIREAVRPYIVPAPDPQQGELIAQVDRAISGQMRAILHDPDFQGLEAAWRMLRFLVSQVETDEMLRIYIIDVTKAELAADLASADQLESAGTYRLLVKDTAEPYAVLLGGYTFDHAAQDITLLRQLGQVANAAGAPFLAGADSHFAGCESIAATPEPHDWHRQTDKAAMQLWQELRRSPEAAYIGLVLPRFLLRLPYGSQTDPAEAFDFEEFSPYAGHEQYLWGNSAAVCACLLAQAFGENGWSLTSGLGCELAGLPMHIYNCEGEKHVTGCTETLLTERAIDLLIGRGLMPAISIKGRDVVRIPRFQSIAQPLSALAGPWR